MTPASLLIGLALWSSPAAPAAAPVLPQQCLQDVEAMLGARLREYRAVVVGQPKASQAPNGSVRYDTEGRPWIKVKSDSWKTLTPTKNHNYGPGYPIELLDLDEETRGDDAVDDDAEFPPRRGWLMQKTASTSEFLPPLLQSMRALQCKTEAVCDLLDQSLKSKEGGSLTVRIAGCEEEKDLPAMPRCGPNDTEGKETLSLPEGADVVKSCQTMVESLLVRERTLLKMLVTYDAAYRSLLQFLGMIDTFFAELRDTLLGPVWQAVRAFHALGRIPCFSAQCEQ